MGAPKVAMEPSAASRAIHLAAPKIAQGHIVDSNVSAQRVPRRASEICAALVRLETTALQTALGTAAPLNAPARVAALAVRVFSVRQTANLKTAPNLAKVTSAARTALASTALRGASGTTVPSDAMVTCVAPIRPETALRQDARGTDVPPGATAPTARLGARVSSVPPTALRTGAQPDVLVICVTVKGPRAQTSRNLRHCSQQVRHIAQRQSVQRQFHPPRWWVLQQQWRPRRLPRRRWPRRSAQ
jgi:hypothetical protein